MTKKQPRARWYHAAIQKIASFRLTASIFSRVLYRIDMLAIRLTKGKYSVTNKIAGLPIVTLTTTGAKSGKQRTVPLAGIFVKEKVVLIASYWGRPSHPAWYHNLKANPKAWLSTPEYTGTYTAHEAEGAEYDEYWAQAVKLYAGFEAYKQRTGNRKIQVMVLTPKF